MSNTTKKTCDIFISYRRDGGDMTAMYIYQALKERKYDVFYDLEVLRAGRFNDSLLEYIGSCKDFILVLSPGSLDRCNDENDWVRKEIAEALRLKKNIIPIMLKGFKFPDELPDDIDDVRYQNGLTATTEYFQESMNRLCTKYMTTKQKKASTIPVIAGIAIAAVACLGIGGKVLLDKPSQPEVVIIESESETEILAASEPVTELVTEAPETEVVTEKKSEVNLTTPVSNTDWPRMKQDCPWDDYPNLDYESAHESGTIPSLPVFHNESVSRQEIGSVTFLNSLEQAGEDAWDISEAQDGSVLVWVEKNGDLYDLSIAGDGGVTAPDNFSGFFDNYLNVTSISFNGCLDFSETSYMYEAFNSCSSLKTLDLRTLDTGSVIGMNNLFMNCKRLTSIDFSTWNTRKVQEMSGLFWGCKKLKTLDISNFTTTRVRDISSLFRDCTALEEVNLGNIDTSHVENMVGMFCRCESLLELDVSNFDTSRVKYMSQMFEACNNLLTLDVSGFDTSNVTDMSHMFYDGFLLDKLDVSGFDTSNVTSMQGTFAGCHVLETLDLSNWNTENVSDMTLMFEDCSQLKWNGAKEGVLYEQYLLDQEGTTGNAAASKQTSPSSVKTGTITASWDKLKGTSLECPFAYDETTGHSYVFVSKPYARLETGGNWDNRGQLININSKEELDFLAAWALQEDLNFDESWIQGVCMLSDLDPNDPEAVWKNVAQKRDLYYDWDVLQPDGSGIWLQLRQHNSPGAVQMKMDDLHDAKKRTFILEYDCELHNGDVLQTAATATSKSDASMKTGTVTASWDKLKGGTLECPFAYDKATGHSYVFVSKPSGRLDAGGKWDDRAKLVSINSADELDFLTRWAQQEGLDLNETWIQGVCSKSDLDPDQPAVSWDTVAKQRDLYLDWDAGQPSGKGTWLQLLQLDTDGTVILKMGSLYDSKYRCFILEYECELQDHETLLTKNN